MVRRKKWKMILWQPMKLYTTLNMMDLEINIYKKGRFGDMKKILK